MVYMIAKVDIKKEGKEENLAAREYVRGYFGRVITYEKYSDVIKEIKRLNACDGVKKNNTLYIVHYEPLH